jgi:hypothetical protein
MEILPIFPENSPAIYAVRFDGQSQDEFSRVFALWTDVEYLESFFEDNKDDLCGGYFGCLGIEDAVERTLDDVRFLEHRLLELAEKGLRDPHNTLQQLFVPLNNKV